MLTPNNEQGAAPPAEPAPNAADVIAPPLDVAAVTPNKKPNQRGRMRRRMEHMQSEIEQLRAQLARGGTAPSQDIAALKTELESIRAERNQLAELLELAMSNLTMY